MIVVKFGGTSLAGVERMRAAARIVAAHRRDQMVVCVVSAMAGVTDALIRIGEIAAQGRPERQVTITEIREQHLAIITALTTITTTEATSEITPRFEAAWSALEADLARLGASAHDGRGAQPEDIARFSAWGERLSTLLFTLALRAEGVEGAPFAGEPVIASARRDAAASDDAQHCDGSWARLTPSLAATRAALTLQVAQAMASGATLVMPGYIARSDEGELLTLGRNGSDYSAAIIGGALRADAVYIYSDVVGVHRADPHVAPQADLLPALTYGDAAELARHGARILHPATVHPLASAGIPLHLRSALAPENPGTVIGSARHIVERGATTNDWVITARPAITSDPLLGLRDTRHDASELVVVSCVLLDHSDHADHTAEGREERMRARPARGASRRRFQLIVPAGKAAAIQRQLFAALRHLDQHSALLGLMDMAPALHTLEVR